MLYFITRIRSSYEKYVTQLARQRTLQLLSQQSDATLQDIGVSRELLNGGVVSWPWRSSDPMSRQCTQTESEQCLPVAAVKNSTQRPDQTSSSVASWITNRSLTTYHKVMARARAIRELHRFSDRELRDLGITRGGIVEAVNYGRPGMEQPGASAPTSAMYLTVAKQQRVANIENEDLFHDDRRAA